MFGIVTRNFFNRKVNMKFDDYLFAFDFDGTLVKSTKFINQETNDQNFKEFKLFINPDAFEINWCIVTSRPKCDIEKLKECLQRNQAFGYQGIYHQPYDIPVCKCREEYSIKADHLINLCNSQKRRLVYVDNSENVRLMVEKELHDKVPDNDVLFKDTVTLFKYFVKGEFDK